MTPGSFSATGRDGVWTSVDDGIYDLIVVGGGITGAGVARDAAGRGLRVALIEQDDIGAGTSSRSSRLIHGGLRYLETYDFDLVFEALRERRRLLELAPHLVKPLPFLFPIFAGESPGPLKLRAGMWLYDALSTFRSPRRHQMLNAAGVAETEPLLRRDGIRGGAIYYDAQVDDARLTLEVARAAADAGADVLTYARVEGIEGSGSGFRVSIVDTLASGRRTDLRARLVLNATGPWSDRVRRLADPAIRPRLRTTKGVHVVVDRKRVGNRGAIILRSSVDGRVMFVLPWGKLTYIGTTDTEFSGDPATVRATPADVEYLLKSANSIFPEARLGLEDVVSTWAGVRPLLAPTEGERLAESQTSREHAIWRDASGLVNIAGGKLTTYRSMAQEAVDYLASILKDEHGIETGEYHTDLIPLPGTPEEDWEEASARLREEARTAGLSDDVATALANRYGVDASRILALVRADPHLAERLLPDEAYIRAEVIHSVRHELALTLEDVMQRRMHLFYEEVDGGLGIAPIVAELMAGEDGLRWTESEKGAQVAAYAEAVAATRPSIDASS